MKTSLENASTSHYTASMFFFQKWWGGGHGEVTENKSNNHNQQVRAAKCSLKGKTQGDKASVLRINTADSIWGKKVI